MRNYGNVPDEILGVRVHYFDDEYKTLAEMIGEVTDEPIEHAKYVLTVEDGVDFRSFVAWTKTSVLTLIKTPYGSHIFASDRNYE